MRRFCIFFVVVFLFELSYGQEYIDYKIRTNNFYAHTDETGAFDWTYADPTWHFRGKVSSSSSSGSWSSYECVNSTDSDASGAYNNGEWFNQATLVRWTGTCLSNADNIYIEIEGWEEQNDTPCTYESTKDDFYSSDTDYDTNISGSHTRAIWTDFQRDNGSDNFVDCGTVGSNGYYLAEFEVWWNWSLPENPEFSITDIATSSFTINLTDKKQYRITDWNYQVSANAAFTDIVSSATETEPLSFDITSGLTAGKTYYVRIRGENEAGAGAWTSYQTITTLDPTVNFASDSQSSSSENGTMTITAELSEESGKDVTIPFTINGLSTAAGGGTDYSITGSPISISAGSATGEITITVSEDLLDENDETVIVELGTPTNATLGTTATLTATIVDDDDAPTVRFTSASQTSTNESGTMTITAELSATSGKDVIVPFAVSSSSTATGGGTDYSITESPISISAGNTTGEIMITISEDVLDESDETIIIDMGAPTNATQGIITTYIASIIDDDAIPTISTISASSITSVSANLGGNMTDDGGSAVTEKGIIYSATNATPVIDGADVTKDTSDDEINSFNENIEGFSTNTTYYFRAYATNVSGTGYGEVESFTTKHTQTITFNSIPDKTYGDSDFDPAATASSGLTVSYSSSDASVATIVEGKIHITGSGYCTIYANQSGDATSDVAPQAFQSLTVDKAALTVTAENKTKEYDGIVYDSFTVSYSDFVDGEDENDLDGALAFNGTATSAINVGTNYVITPEGLSSPNYDIAFVDGSLDITQKALNITAENKTKEYDGTIHDSFTVSYLGFVDGEDENDLEGALAFSGAATSAINVGTDYVITPEGLSSPNYDIAFIDGELDITQKALTIWADDKTKEYDGTVYSSFTVTYNGFVTGEDEGDLDGMLIFGGNATTAVNAGTGYVITPGGLISTNYNIAFVDGNLDITPATQTITFNSLNTKVYGDAPFNLTGTASSGQVVTYTSSNTEVATISGNTVTIIGAGATNITASQAGNTNYSPAPDVVQELTISKADQLLTLNELPVGNLPLKDFADPIQVTASSSSGLSVNISLGEGSVAVLNESDQLESVGSTGNVIVNVDQDGDANHNAASISYTFDVVKSNQSITFPALSAQTYSPGLTVDLSTSATTSSALNVNYSVAVGPGTINKTTLAVNGAGNILLTASQEGDEIYNPATAITQTLTINKATPVIGNFDELRKEYGDESFTLNSSSASTGLFTYSSSNSSVATISGNVVTIVGVGTSELTAVQDFDNNYLSTNKTVILTVNLSDQVITFDELEVKVMGDPDFTLSASGGDSGKPVVFTSSDEAVARCSGTNGESVEIVGVGTCTIYANQAGNNNYHEAIQVSQILTVNGYIAGDTDRDGIITDPEIVGDIDGNGQIDDGEVTGDTDGDGQITSPEIAGDTDGNGQIDDGEIAGDIDGDGTITDPEIAGDNNGNGQINDDEVAGDTDGDGQITSPEIAGDADGNGQIDDGEIAGDVNGDGTITNLEIAGDTDGDGTIAELEIRGDTDGDGTITFPEVEGDSDGDGDIDDTDGDGTPDHLDAFPTDPSEQKDTDGDGIGDNADTDDDNDGVSDSHDAFPYDSTESKDRDGDGVGDNADTDDDDDGVPDSQDAFPYDSNESKDADGDGIGNNADTDDDNDGIPDSQDAFPFDPTESEDSDGDGIGDNQDAYPNDPSKNIDNTAPVVNCRSLTLYVNDPSTYVLTEADIAYMTNEGETYDDVTPYEELEILVSKESFSGDDIGLVVPVNISLTDDSGNVGECETTVQILENHSPEVIGIVDTIYVDKNSTTLVNLPASLFIESDGGQSLSYKLTSEDGSNLPEWINFEADSLYLDSLEISMFPTEQELGEHKFKLTASDGLGKNATVNVMVVVQIPTGIVELEESFEIQVFPNPSSGSVNIEFDHFVDADIELSIQDISGKEVYRGKYDSHNNPINLDLSGYIDGFYFIRMKMGDTVIVKRIVLRK